MQNNRLLKHREVITELKRAEQGIHHTRNNMELFCHQFKIDYGASLAFRPVLHASRGKYAIRWRARGIKQTYVAYDNTIVNALIFSISPGDINLLEMERLDLNYWYAHWFNQRQELRLLKKNRKLAKNVKNSFSIKTELKPSWLT